MRTSKTLLRLCLILFALVIVTAALLPATFAKEEETVLIESRQTLWRYYVTDARGFDRMADDWYLPSFDSSSWETKATPFGDEESHSGWAGNNHGIYLVTTFTVDTLPENCSLHLYMHYDNTAKFYLNGNLLYEDEGWNDRMEDFFFSTEFLVEGKNTLAVSILDDVGGRYFDLTASLSSKSAAEIEPPDTTTVSPEEAGTPLISASHTLWQYTVTTTEGFHEMDADWKSADFDRSSWKEGAGPFGTNISSANGDRTGWKGDNHGIFLVSSFVIEDLTEALSKYFYMDIYFDNTITIYLNEQRVFYHEDWNAGYQEIGISLKNALKEGTNTLAVSLLDDIGGREFDMSLYMTDRVITSGAEVLDSELVEAGLPILRIDTDSGDYVRSRLTYVTATMVFDNMSAYPNEDNIYTEEGGAAIEIRGRGNSTWNNGYPDGKQNTLPGDTHTRKVPYNIKLDEKVNLFGMGTSKKWVLLANYMDRSNLRNKLIFDLSGRMGMTYPQSVFVNLVLNGEYMGIYALCEKVDVDLFEGQVTDFEDYAEDFAKAVAKEKGYDKEWRSLFEEELCKNLSWLTDEYYQGYKVSDYVDLSDVSTQTGYLIEYDGYADEDSFFTTNHGVPLKVSNLEGIKSNDKVFSELKSYFNAFEEALYSDTFYNSQGKHYSEYVDIDSFVDYFILNTLILNVEFGYKSMYMVLGEDQKLTFGPCWDYDWSSGNPFLGANGQYDQWYNDSRANNNKWYRQVYGDPWFVALVKERWATLTDAIDDMIDSMDTWEEHLLPSSVIEYRKFSADSYETDFKSRTGGRSFSEEVAQLKTFLLNRKAWLDQQFSKRDPDIEGFGMDTSASLSLSLGGQGIARGTDFDYASQSSTGAALVSIKYRSSATAKVYVNGLETTTVALSANTTSTASIDLATLDKGVNAITVYAFNQSGNLLAVNYLTLTLPGEKQVAPTLGSYLPGSEEGIPPTPPDTEAPETSSKPESTDTPETTAKPESTDTPEITAKPETPDTPDTPTEETKTLSAETLDAYIQLREEADGKETLRLVFVAKESYLFTHEALYVKVVFKTATEQKIYQGSLSLVSNDYTLYRTITAEGTTFVAESNNLLFGNAFTGIPKDILESITVTVTDQGGNRIFAGTYELS